MAEVKNSFLASKMNKDLDARLIPSNQYRNAFNVAISKSEDSDVGALENILGNTLVATETNFGANATFIGYCVDEINEKIYLFITDYTDTSPTNLTNNQAAVNQGSSSIVCLDIKNNANTFTTLVTGRFLNFSTTHPIYGANILENLLFWTDNRNQPRKINIDSAILNSLIGPASVISLTGIGNGYNDGTYNTFNGNPGSSGSGLTVSITTIGGAISSVAIVNPGDGYSTGEVLAVSGPGPGIQGFIIINEIQQYYHSEDTISVAKYAPYKSIDLVTESGGTYTGTMKDVVSPSTIDGAAGYATSIVSNASVIPINTTYGTFTTGDVITLQPPDIDKIPTGTTVAAGSTSTSLNTSQPVGVTTPLAANDVIVYSPNPDFINNYSGDPVFLQDKFVKFSYRFKFDDNEYSIIAPFTQSAFIPQQDGRFLEGDEEESYTSGEVAFMKNKVNFIELIINFPDNVTGANLFNSFKIKEIDIIYQESSNIAKHVLDTISLDDITTNHSGDTFYKYRYQSRKPILTLPSSEANRVYDKTPVKALSQEVSGNRIIYANYVDKHTAPKKLNYQVSASRKIQTGALYSGIDKEYPESTLKRNRNYQLGVVLRDRYGRESDVVLSSVGSDTASTDLTNFFGASTFYFPYRNNNTVGSVLDDIGNSIKIQFNEKIKSTFSPLQYGNPTPTGDPGLYSSTNPLGWYSYKIVVKQTEQEYYNVYTPGIVNGDFNLTNAANSGFAFTTLISDSLNKVPKELLDASGNQNQFRSDTLLYCVVDTPPKTGGGGGHPSDESINAQAFPGNTNNTVTTLSTVSDMGGVIDSTGGSVDSHAIFQARTNPFIVKLATPISLGKLYNTTYAYALSVFETNPFVSNLDIYYETSTAGLISDLNTLIGARSGNEPAGFTALNYLQRESQNPSGTGTSTGDANSPYVTSQFRPIDSSGGQINQSEIINFTVIDGGGNNRDNFFAIELDSTSGDDVYRIKINPQPPSPENGFYFGPNAQTLETYTFNMDVRNEEDTATADVNGAVSNSTTITVDNLVDGTASNGIFETMQVFNGSTLLGVIDTITAGGGTGDTTATFNLVDPVTVANDVSLTFKAQFVNLQALGALSNVDPIIETYDLITPQYSTLAVFTGNVVGRNGSFDTSRNTLDLIWGFTDTQASIIADGYTFTVDNNPLEGSDAFLRVIRGGGTSDSITIKINQSSGELSKGDGFFWSDLTIVIKLTDAGGATDTRSINLLVEPGAFTDSFSTAFDI